MFHPIFQPSSINSRSPTRTATPSSRKPKARPQVGIQAPDLRSRVAGAKDAWRHQYPAPGFNYTDADPQYVNSSASDFRIRSGSPGENAGESLGLKKDYAGNDVGNPPEIGAFEIM